ncbi:SGNH/GDSL hydrolase family protein [Catenuloplanes atrovinosus]|uniref:Lysophospholipase L1-like esterase n=1 Tax=Catenuloplanes atrovinosus TaxID=137266 RepID=A0AAE4C8J2_9ACTN|nr:SGNH/GDSL hydrolase family protein [Catenuloplanes atrovinosus]MDR7275038.1 lysophospholipase L1-like esterase [Catenuloplanes atrovinosus]
MTLLRRRPLAALMLFVLAIVLPGSAGTAQPPRPSPAWVGTWATGPTTVPPGSVTTLERQTFRQVVHASIGGDTVRVRLTNEFGETPLRIGAAHVARRAGTTGTDINPRTDRPLTFGGSGTALVPPGAPLLSDPVPLALPAGGDLVISIYLPERTPVGTVHAFSFQENVIADGDVTAARSVTPVATATQWFLLSGVSVSTRAPRASAVAAFGDSITDGAVTENGANHRWPDLLAARLRATPGVRDRGVLNLGISGNRLLHDPHPTPGAEGFAAWFGVNGLARFDRDVLAQPGVGAAIVLLGINDIGQPGGPAPASEAVTAEEIIAGHRQLIARAHAAGIEIYAGTLLPFKGDTLGFYTEANEAKRAAVNHWLRTSGEYDGIVDFDAAVRDPADPLRLRPAFDSGDGLHPNDAGMAAMAAAVPLHWFR